jgi:hypothetical protein
MVGRVMPIEANSLVTKPARPKSSIQEYAPIKGGDMSAITMKM